MSEYNEDAYRDARKSVNPSPCAFEKGVLARCISCSKGEKHLLAERETVNCTDPAAQARCAEWLLDHAESDNRESLAVQFTQRKRQIAEQLGIAPETLSRVLRDLRERGFIRGRGRVLDVVDPNGLRHLVGA